MTCSHSKPTALIPVLVAVACVGLLISSLNGVDVVASVLRPGLSSMQFGPTTGTELADFIEATEPTATPLLNRQQLIDFGRSVGDEPILPALRDRYLNEPHTPLNG
jgi:hypothetical protein